MFISKKKHDRILQALRSSYERRMQKMVIATEQSESDVESFIEDNRRLRRALIESQENIKAALRELSKLQKEVSELKSDAGIQCEAVRAAQEDPI